MRNSFTNTGTTPTGIGIMPIICLKVHKLILGYINSYHSVCTICIHIAHTGKICMQSHSISTCISINKCCVFTNTDDKNFPILLQFILGEPLIMIRSISLTELISGNGVNVSYTIRPMNVLRISTSFCTVEAIMLFLTYIVSKTESFSRGTVYFLRFLHSESELSILHYSQLQN